MTREMNAVEKLLSFDAGKISTPTKAYVMNLKKLDHEPFEFQIQAIDPEIMSELQESILEVDSKSQKMTVSGSFNRKAMTIVEGCPGIFKNKDLQKHFGAASPKELVKKLLVSGEMDDLQNEIEKLSGYETEEDVKN